MKPVIDEKTRTDIAEVIRQHRDTLSALPGFIKAEPGLPLVHGWVVKEPAIILYVQHKKPRSALLASEIAPRMLGGVRVDVVQATPEQQLAASTDLAATAAALEVAAATLKYKKLPHNPVNEEYTVERPLLCHVGPDAGWPVLKRFLEGTRDTLSVAMYDLNAEWVVSTLIKVVKDSEVAVTLTWDDGMTPDETTFRKRLKRSLGDSLDGWLVECGASRRFASAYHEKVAVRDSQSFWLSSGNWSKRSQPEIDPIADPDSARGMYSKGNREWHVIVDDAPLAKLFEKYIRYDRDESEAEDSALAVTTRVVRPELFVPIDVLAASDLALATPRPVAPARVPSTRRKVKVQPVLSPDNYVAQIKKLIGTAHRSLYLQYSYITYPTKDADREFRELLELVGDLTNRDDIDVRIIVGSGDAQVKVPKLVEAGFNDECIRVQGGIHNKGIIVDSSVVLVSSANWSGDGVLWNRDAGLIIHDAEVARYYEQVFLDDWDKRARQFIDNASASVRIAPAGAATPPGMVRMTWDDYYGE
jgi:phosphatidylserine/phosphatidylglycerophosphate/cardiolipin synthase-like enzyme